jgi:hypothetical protein
MKLRSVSGTLCCGLGLVLALGMTAAIAAAGPRKPRLLTNFGDSFRVRPAIVVFGMVGITGPDVTPTAYRAGRFGHIVWVRWSSNEALGHGRAWVPDAIKKTLRPYPATVRAWRVRDGRYTRVRWTYGAGSHPYTEWDDLLRFGRSYDWRVVRVTGSG